jgi:hypothetical protein
MRVSVIYIARHPTSIPILFFISFPFMKKKELVIEEQFNGG